MRERLDRIQDRIRIAADTCGRSPESVQLVAVSKTVPADRVRAAVEAGVSVLGENYIQEARQKIEVLADLRVSWHFIGHLQSNKAKYAVRLFDLIHTVDSLKLAQALDKEAAKHEKVQQILLQINTGMEVSKSGAAPESALALAEAVARLPHLKILGLMTLPPYFDAPEKVRPFFRALREIRDRISAARLPGVDMAELSMGMTGDFEAAIQEGATLVRIGTAIFGERS